MPRHRLSVILSAVIMRRAVMAMNTNPEQLLESANLGLARLLGREPLALSEGGGRALQDTLWVWGVLGGKEVGKSTLINALAGAEVAEATPRLGEGTFRPTAYGAAADMPALARRLDAAQQASLRIGPAAPPDRRGLVLVDLPDFDSLFDRHVELVREVARVLDGVIWVTTPKKLGDVRAIAEIRRVLKARVNFVYVVNKIDWLLSQSNGSPQADLERTRQSLARQIAASAGEDAGQTYLISALYGGGAELLEAIARGRSLGADQLRSASPQITEVVQSVADDFSRLRRRLASPPSAGEAEANKRANLAYQVGTQSRALLDHFQPQMLLHGLQQELSPAGLQELAMRALPPAYCVELARRLQDPQKRGAEWAQSLFRARIANWPLLGVIAWPLVALGAVVEAVRQLRPRAGPTNADDLFRTDGVALEERLHHVLSMVEQRLGPTAGDLALDLPEPESLAAQFRSQAAARAAAQSEAAIASYFPRPPTRLGRFLRGLIPLAVLAWFPLVQPLLAAGLRAAGIGAESAPAAAGTAGETGARPAFDPAILALLVTALSAQQVLLGLLVSLLILAALVAAIYSGAVRDAHAAARRLADDDPRHIAEPLLADVIAAVRAPLEAFEHELAGMVRTLEELNESGRRQEPGE
jgi:hypothetical protein